MRIIIKNTYICLASLLLMSCSNSSKHVQLGYTSATEPQIQTYSPPPKENMTVTYSEDLSTAPVEKQIKHTQIAKIQQPTKAIEPPPEKDAGFGPLLNPLAARNMINDYRRKAGLKPLKLNDGLTKAAKQHSSDMAKKDKISHIGSDGSDPMKRILKQGYNASIAAETIGTGQISFNELLEKWKADPQHKQKLLLPEASHMGIALVHNPHSKSKTFWTLVLAGGK